MLRYFAPVDSSSSCIFSPNLYCNWITLVNSKMPDDILSTLTYTTFSDDPRIKVWPARQFSMSLFSTIFISIPSRVKFGIYLDQVPWIYHHLLLWENHKLMQESTETTTQVLKVAHSLLCTRRDLCVYVLFSHRLKQIKTRTQTWNIHMNKKV